jgi:hypothetical protein
MKLALMLRSRGFVACIHAGLWLLLYLSVTGLRGKAPELREEDPASSIPAQSPAPVAKLDALFSPSVWPKSPGDTNLSNPFFTRYFIPPATPAAPVPTTRKIEVTYQGFYETADGPRQVIVKVGEAFIVAPIGAKVATNLFVSAATMQMLTLTNLAAQTNIVSLNAKKEIEVPIP